MHELSVINSIHSVALRHAAINQVQKIMAIHLQVGALSDLEDKWMQQYFDFLSRGSIAEGARLVIERVPAVRRCEDCESLFEINTEKDMKPVCSRCGCRRFTLVSGREYFIKNLEVL